ncbi:hypothetical protein DV495_000901 [Geotrichum candidum]|nr:hypothetical protein DV454_001571 [Geotrichum candidum]KAF5135271.1 hypothetical protein DV495_000901 [Geotrichum candidum]
MNSNYLVPPSKSPLSLPKFKVPESYPATPIATPNMENTSYMPSLLPPLAKVPGTPLPTPQLPYNQSWPKDVNRQQLPSLKHLPLMDFHPPQHHQPTQHPEYYPPPQPYYSYQQPAVVSQPPQPQYYATYHVKQQSHTHHTILNSSREIKRRTKTGSTRCSESCSKMNINSLLDAAAVIEEETSSRKRKASSVDVDSEEPSATRAPKKLCAATLDDRSCDSWDDVERIFTENIAGFLDSLLATDRFSQMNILGKAKVCGLPLDGGDAINIPIGGTISSPNGTVRVGQDLATLESTRHLLSILCPSFYLDNLSIDDPSVGKLEELRISSDYKLLRAVVQLMTASKHTQFLPVDDKDEEIFQRIQALHRFITGDEQQLYRATPAPENQHQVSGVLARGLKSATPTELWSVLTMLAQEPVQLAPADEDELVELARSSSSDAALRVPLLLATNHYLLTRRPQQQLVAGKDNSLKLLLHESSSSGMNGNVVARRLVNMVIN